MSSFIAQKSEGLSQIWKNSNINIQSRWLNTQETFLDDGDDNNINVWNNGINFEK